MVEYPVHTRSVTCSSQVAATRPVGQAVKTPPFHGGNMGSIPVRVTKKADTLKGICFFAVRTGIEEGGRAKQGKKSVRRWILRRSRAGAYYDRDCRIAAPSAMTQGTDCPALAGGKDSKKWTVEVCSSGMDYPSFNRREATPSLSIIHCQLSIENGADSPVLQPSPDLSRHCEPRRGVACEPQRTSSEQPPVGQSARHTAGCLLCALSNCTVCGGKIGFVFHR